MGSINTKPADYAGPSNINFGDEDNTITSGSAFEEVLLAQDLESEPDNTFNYEEWRKTRGVLIGTPATVPTLLPVTPDADTGPANEVYLEFVEGFIVGEFKDDPTMTSTLGEIYSGIVTGGVSGVRDLLGGLHRLATAEDSDDAVRGAVAAILSGLGFAPIRNAIGRLIPTSIHDQFASLSKIDLADLVGKGTQSAVETLQAIPLSSRLPIQSADELFDILGKIKGKHLQDVQIERVVEKAELLIPHLENTDDARKAFSEIGRIVKEAFPDSYKNYDDVPTEKLGVLFSNNRLKPDDYVYRSMPEEFASNSAGLQPNTSSSGLITDIANGERGRIDLSAFFGESAHNYKTAIIRADSEPGLFFSTKQSVAQQYGGEGYVVVKVKVSDLLDIDANFFRDAGAFVDPRSTIYSSFDGNLPFEIID